MEDYFNELAGIADRRLRAGERHTLSFAAERTDFVRMNRGKVRQPGHVEQRTLDVGLIHGARHASHLLTLSGDIAVDARSIEAAIGGLRAALPELADDPHLLLPSFVASSRHERGETLPPA